jgi:hypothetical protein
MAPFAHPVAPPLICLILHKDSVADPAAMFRVCQEKN